MYVWKSVVNVALNMLVFYQSTEPVDLTKSLFQFCFSFTMKQKLAPLWNKAGEFLVQGIVDLILLSSNCVPELYISFTIVPTLIS